MSSTWRRRSCKIPPRIDFPSGSDENFGSQMERTQREYGMERECGDIPCHVIAAFLKFDHGLAPEATLPTLVLGLCHKPYRILILGAVPTAMPPAVAAHTNLSLTLVALAKLSPVVGVADVLGADELAAALLGAIDAVAGRVLDVLFVPGLLEFVVKKAVHVFQGDGGRGAALGRHVLRVRNGQLEASLEARVAHPVAAFQLGRLAGRDVVHTDDTFHSDVDCQLWLELGDEAEGRGLTFLHVYLWHDGDESVVTDQRSFQGKLTMTSASMSLHCDVATQPPENR